MNEPPAAPETRQSTTPPPGSGTVSGYGACIRLPESPMALERPRKGTKVVGHRSVKQGRAARRALGRGRAPALHFLPTASAVNPRFGKFGVWGCAPEVDRSAYSRSDRMCRLPSKIGAAHASLGFWPSPGIRPKWADRNVWRSRAKYCQVFIEEVGRLPD